MTHSNDSFEKKTIIMHLLELRTRLIKCSLAIAIVFCGLFYFANDIYHYFSLPMLNQLPNGSQMIATQIVSPFFAPLKLTFMVALFVCIPYLLFHLWAYIAPGLYQKEKRLMMPLMIASTLLFYMGMAFAFYVLFPVLFKFLAFAAPEGVAITPDISEYLNTCLKLFFAFGLSFEVPIVIVLLIITGAASAQTLAHQRPYIIVGAFIVGMLLTPPDVVSQIFLAIPIWLLFELGLLVGKVIHKRSIQAKET